MKVPPDLGIIGCKGCLIAGFGRTFAHDNAGQIGIKPVRCDMDIPKFLELTIPEEKRQDNCQKNQLGKFPNNWNYAWPVQGKILFPCPKNGALLGQCTLARICIVFSQ